MLFYVSLPHYLVICLPLIVPVGVYVLCSPNNFYFVVVFGKSTFEHHVLSFHALTHALVSYQSLVHLNVHLSFINA
jgi:hypothetical protein